MNSQLHLYRLSSGEILMKLYNFRFKNSTSHYQNQVFNNTFLKDIRQIICIDKGVFILVTQFFYINSDNKQSEEDIKKDLEIEKRLIEIDYKDDITCNYTKLADELIFKLTSLFSSNVNLKEFSDIRNQYIEWVILYWKSLPGKYTKVYHEPVIFYKRRRCFDKAVYTNSVCDVVHIDRKLKHFEMYECKTTMRAFLMDLSTNHRVGSTRVKKRAISRSKRKQNYMNAFRNMLLNKVDGLENKEVAYVTLAPSNDLVIKNKKVDNIGGVPIISREIIFDSFYSLNLGTYSPL